MYLEVWIRLLSCDGLSHDLAAQVAELMRRVRPMETNLTSWKKHIWISHHLELVPGAPLILQVCRECGRAFVDECSTGERYAVHVSIFKFHRLSDEVTARWLSEKCPDEHLAADETNRQTRYLGGSFRSAVGERANADLDLGSSPNPKIG